MTGVQTCALPISPQGLVELEGYAWPLKTASPIRSVAGNLCVFQSLYIEKSVKSGDSHDWKVVGRYVSRYPFYLCDATGVATVHPTDLECEISEVTRSWSDLTDEEKKSTLSLPIVANDSFFGGHDLPTIDTGFFSGTFRVREKRLLVGAPVLVHGYFHTHSHPGNVHAVHLDEKLVAFFARLKSILKNPARYQKLFDKNGNGDIDMAEAISGFHYASLGNSLGRSLSSSLNNSPDKSPTGASPNSAAAVNPALRHFGEIKAHSESPAFIADCHQKHFVSRIGKWNLVTIFGGLALIIGATIIAMPYFSFL